MQYSMSESLFLIAESEKKLAGSILPPTGQTSCQVGVAWGIAMSTRTWEAVGSSLGVRGRMLPFCVGAIGTSGTEPPIPEVNLLHMSVQVKASAAPYLQICEAFFVVVSVSSVSTTATIKLASIIANSVAMHLNVKV